MERNATLQSDSVKIETPEFSPWNGRDQSPPLTGTQRLLVWAQERGVQGEGCRNGGVEGQGCACEERLVATYRDAGAWGAGERPTILQRGSESVGNEVMKQSCVMTHLGRCGIIFSVVARKNRGDS